QIELTPDAAEPLPCFEIKNELISLKCVIVNPEVRFQVVAPPPPLSNFPSCLKELTLSGFGYPWEYMSKIASFWNLEVLKLRCYAFRGPKWVTKRRGFLRLEFLLIEDTDLVHWTAEPESFPKLHQLSIKHCYKLQEIPWEFSESLRSIEVVDSTPLGFSRDSCKANARE
ncbi:hypothetical protein Pfo_031296, partial [Paulownia fortunei]